MLSSYARVFSMADQGILSEAIRADIEGAVAEGLRQDDLRGRIDVLDPDVGASSDDLDEVDLVVPWVFARCRDKWPKILSESDSFRPLIDGCVVASIQAQDLAAGRDPSRSRADGPQRRWLERWRRQSTHENP
jgi:hypothetical protein